LGENENYEIKIKTEEEIGGNNRKFCADETKETKISNSEIQCG